MSLLSELSTQPAVIDRILATNEARIAEIAEGLADQDILYVVIAARGTSDNAARYAKYLWGASNRLPVELAAPALYGTYERPPRLTGALVVGISQSGTSPDLVAVLEEANRQGRPTLAITNEPESPMAEVADFLLDIGAGEEHAVAATKTYTAQLLAVAMLSQALGGEGSPAAQSSLGDAAQSMLDQSEDIRKMAEAFVDADYCVTLARGYNHATAFEWALKLQELANVLAHPYSTADFQHGPIALVEAGFPLLAVAPTGPPQADMLTLLTRLQEDRRPRLLIVSDDSEALALTPHGIRLPTQLPEWLTPIPAIIGGQLFTYHLTTARGFDPDSPRGLSKVTRTR